MAADCELTNVRLSVECVDNAAGRPGVVIYDNKTIPISSHQDATQVTASGEGPGLQSSVRVFQLDCYSNEGDITLFLEPSEIVTNSNGSVQAEEDE